MTNFFTSNKDLTFYYEKVIDWDRLAPFYREPGDTTSPAELAGTWREVLGLAGEYLGDQVAPRAREVDRLGTPHSGDVKVSEPMAENMRGLAELDLIGVALPREYGGAGLPFSVHAGIFEMLARADSAAMVQYAFYSSPATMLLRFGTDAQKQQWVPRLAKGEIIGWVAMTEPEAGSDVGAVQTRATRQPGGSWRISGRKQFISSGNGQVGLVLARAVPGSKGLEGLSLFLVPRCVPDEHGGERENYTIERAEEKVCINGSPTCALSFDDSQAEILGRPGDGWRQITSFMNEARVAVGIQSTGVAQAALSAAQSYAAQRVQMGKPIREHPLVAEMLLDMQTTVAAMRALWMEAAVAHDLTQAFETRLHELPEHHPERAMLEQRQKRISRYLRDLTPLVKYFNAEEAIRVARTSLQVYGGNGVIKDNDVERYVRDSLILPIYEGTSQIQALMAVKDLLRHVTRDPRHLLTPAGIAPSLADTHFQGELGRNYARALRRLTAAVQSLMFGLARDLGPRGVAMLASGKVELSDEQLGPILLSAEWLTQMLAHLHATRLLGKQAQRWPERQPLALRFSRRTVDVCELNHRRIVRGDRDALAAIAAWQSASAS